MSLILFIKIIRSFNMGNESQPDKNTQQKGKIIIIVLFIAVLASALVLFLSIKPKIILNGEQQMTVEPGSEFSDPGATAVFNSKDISDLLYSKGHVDVNKIGDYKITYSLKYLMRTFSKTRTVTVADTAAPVLTLNGASSVNIFLGDGFIEPGYSAIDSYEGDLSSKVTVTGEIDNNTEGDYLLKYSVSDSSGNIAEAERKVVVKKRPAQDESVIYLTFDDGPSSSVTAQDLDILKKNGIPATFYILNYSPELLPIVKRELSDGHTVGIHGYSHDYSQIYTSPDVAMDNFLKLRDKLYNDTGYAAYTFRFPGGSSNTVSRRYCAGIMTQLSGMVEAAGYSYMDWNVSSGDAASTPLSSDAIAANVINGLKPGRANVVLMHDSGAKAATTAALQRIIDYGNANGYTFASIPEGMTPIHHPINN